MRATDGLIRRRIFLSLGSNIGRRPDNLRRALRLLDAEPGIRVVAVSRLYSTSPVGYTEQNEFLNGAVELRSRLEPRELLRRLKGIEARLGKSTPFRNGPRRIDIDLVLYGGSVIRDRDLTVPHPRMHLRRFVLEPLAEIAPRTVHPVFRSTVARLLAEVEDAGRVRPWGAWPATGGPGRSVHA
ncbi:MAG TPA: 2-amino-4-hydroxy-6-hydroxymethyldihydropteridine diphosphokinase [Candidatus Methanoperedens sp.]|nr:2-amino-4-hydroxy-6-hydroxymethyldihydropteridine diphosphokinase [Candidatus Methanoperedens sp.]